MLASCRITLWENMSGKIWTPFDWISGNCLWSWIFSFNDKMMTVWESCFLALFGFSIWRFFYLKNFHWKNLNQRTWKRKNNHISPQKEFLPLVGNLVIAFIGRTFFGETPILRFKFCHVFWDKTWNVSAIHQLMHPAWSFRRSAQFKKNTNFFAVLLPFEKNLRAFAKPEKIDWTPRKNARRASKLGQKMQFVRGTASNIVDIRINLLKISLILA